MISAAAVSTVSLTYASGGAWSVFNSTNLATAANLQANWTDIASQLNNNYMPLLNSAVSEVTALKSASTITYYANPASGSDTNSGTSAGAAFASIQTAINKLPQTINHVATINMATGSYGETVTISGFNGAGYIQILGGTLVASADSYNISNMIINYNSVYVLVVGVKATSISADGFLVNINPGRSNFSNVICSSTAAGYNAFSTIASPSIDISGSDAANHNCGINAARNANVCVIGCTGSGNSVGLYSNTNASIGIQGTYPTGTTTSLATGGGKITF